MNSSFNRIYSVLILLGLSIAGDALAADEPLARLRNVKGADLELMNNHDPASELQNFDMLPGYEANLFASEPMIANPIHMMWDSRGRLWVACSWAYPQLKPGEEANDKIIILEDTDGDGVADKSTVFADGLYLPTGIELANGGCYVAQSPDVFFFKDTDGDDVADVKELALTGFGIEDSHHSISAWRRGPGGWVYFQEGIFLNTQIETQRGVVRNFNGGVYQYNPRTQELRMFCRGTGGNPWGHVFNRWGQSFMANNPRIMYLSHATGNSGEKVRISPLITTSKQCGGDLATGTHVGDDIRGQFLTGRFKDRSVVRYEFIEDGAGFSANVHQPLIASKHPNFRPVDVKVGPDGAIYVADWYNSIINHAQHDFRDPRRDHEHGRIWRITHKERPLVEKPQLVGKSIEALIENLKSPEAWTRHQARKELSERDPDQVLAAAETWAEALSSDLPEYDHHLVEAMWACQNVERVSEDILKRVLAAKDGHARSAGARIIRYWHSELSDAVSMIATLSGDPFPRTRMEAVLSAGFIPKAEAFVAALGSLDHPGDEFIDLALPQTMKALAPYWRPALEAGELQFEKPAHRQYAEEEAGIGLAARLEEFLKNDSPNEREIKSIQTQLDKVGTDGEVLMIVDALTSGSGRRSPQTTVALLEALDSMAGSNWPNSLNREIGRLDALLSSEGDSIAAAAATCLGAWGMAGNNLVSVLEDGSRSGEVRRSAALAIAAIGGTRFQQRLTKLSVEGDPATRYAAIVGLLRADSVLGIEMAAKLFTADPGGEDPVPALQLLLRNRRGGRSLAEELEGMKLHSSVQTRVSEFHRKSGQLSSELAALFKPPLVSGSLSAVLLAEDMDALTADVEKFGNAARGETIFRRDSLACMSCHAIGSAGPSIGPNLVVVGAAASTEYMVESILSPNAAIAEHFENKLFMLKDNSVQMGVVTFESEKEVVFRDSAQAGKEVTLAKKDISRQQVLPSLMPAGLADQLESRTEFLDLTKFISELGRTEDFANDESPVIRKWRVIAAPANGTMPHDDETWIPAYSKVSGELPTEGLGIGEHVLARGFVTVQTPGRVTLDINERSGLGLWLDGMEIEDLLAPIHLERGRHVLTFALDLEARDESGLRVELVAADSEVRFQPEGGI